MSNVERETVEYRPDCVLIHVISDFSGDDAASMVSAAAKQFEEGMVKICQLPDISGIDEVCAYLDGLNDDDHPTAVMHAIGDTELRNEIRRLLAERQVYSIDILGPYINVLATLTETDPVAHPQE